MATRPEKLELGGRFRQAHSIALFVGGAGLIGAIFAAYLSDPTFKRFYFAYLVSFAFFLGLSLGALFFVLLQHLTRAGWSVAIRRVAETMAAALPVLLALSAPVVVSVALQRGELYRWAQPLTEPARAAQASSAHADQPAEKPSAEESFILLMRKKQAYLNAPFFIARLAIYFAVWSALGIWYWRRSVQQDASGDAALTARMQSLAAPAMVVFGLTVTLAAFDLLMSLDPEWYSTIFGVYFFAGAAVSIYAALIVVLFIFQRLGYLAEAITIEHYHDLGKFLFGFTFFWGYIAFSQYLLLWYGNVPEEVTWFARRGATTVRADINGWSIISLLLLVCNLLIPFAGLLSRHVKRNRGALVFWAVWLLVFHWLDLYWIVMPELDGKVHLGLIELLCLVGIGGIYLAALLRIGLRHGVRPLADPRLEESLAFQNI